MLTIIYRDGKEVCRVEYSGEKVVSICGLEEEKFKELLNKRSNSKYIWEVMVDDILAEEGYSIRTRHSHSEGIT